MPPHFALTHGAVQVAPLMRLRLLIVAEMQEARTVEDFAHILYNIGANLVIVRCGDHAMILLEPCVMRR